MPFRIVSYNVRYFGHALKGLASTHRCKVGIAHALAALRPAADVICLQEVETISLRSRIAFRGRAHDETQLDALMLELERAWRGNSPYDAYYYPAHCYGKKNRPIYTTGVAVLVNRHRLSV